MKNAFLIGESVYLRPVDMGDCDRFTNWFNDASVRPGVGRTHPIDRFGEEEFIRNAHKSTRSVVLSIVEKSTDIHIGSTGLHGIDQTHRSCIFGITVGDKSKWGKGYGTEATQLMVNYAFGTLNLNRVQLHVFSFNDRAKSVYERVGFNEEGRLRQAQYHEGAYHHDIVMGILRDEWETGRTE